MKRHNGQYPAPVVPIRGWMDSRDLEWLYQRSRENQVIVEVGSAYGRSAHALLTGNYETFGDTGKVYCVDPWPKMKPLNEEFLCSRDMSRKKDFFINCVWFPNMYLLELPSLWAAKALVDQTVDMVFIDGSIPNMRTDIECWWSKPVNLLCGHDFEDDLGRYVQEHFKINIAPVFPNSYLWEQVK